jgi:ketosteroid isomerase-like protein
MALSLLTRADYIDFVERRYFGALREGDYRTVLSYFHADAVLTGYFGDAAPRIMSRAPVVGQASLDEFMRVATDFELRYSDFTHVVDAHAGSVASRFHLHMRPRPRGPMANAPVRDMCNCSFFEFEGGLLKNAVAYFAVAGET